jgi:hypothetical protein
MNPSAGNRSHRLPALGSVNDNRPARNRIRPAQACLPGAQRRTGRPVAADLMRQVAVGRMSSNEPRRLNTDECEAWVALARTLVRLPAALDTQLQRNQGITHFEYQVLAGLSVSPERNVRISEPALFADGSLSPLSHVVKRLERREWGYRTPDPDDTALHPHVPHRRRPTEGRRSRARPSRQVAPPGPRPAGQGPAEAAAGHRPPHHQRDRRQASRLDGALRSKSRRPSRSWTPRTALPQASNSARAEWTRFSRFMARCGAMQAGDLDGSWS